MSDANALRGNPSRRTPRTSRFAPADPTKPPAWLDRTGKGLWTRIAPSLAREGILNAATADLVATACQAYSTYRAALDTIAEEGRVITTHTGARRLNPWVAVEKGAWDVLLKTFRELGVAGAPVAKDGDELDKFLTGAVEKRTG